MPRLYHYSPVIQGWLAAPVGHAACRSPEVAALAVEPCAAGAVLVAAPGSATKVNGHMLCGGLRVLQDRDEIRVGPERFYYSASDPMVVEPYAGPAADCPRCSGSLSQGAAAVRCRCGAWYHQSAELPCFTYGATCPQCGEPTQLEADPWDPADLSSPVSPHLPP